GETSWHGFAAAIVEWMRETGQQVRCRQVMGIPTADYPTPAGRPARSLLDCEKLRREFGIALPDWREQLDCCLEG
ncbi:MAG TPA: sugar nucleotide-binding protein, partial [Desulfuromonadales bacterium]|nr:sugar nucleotide-binding protein [Desulfuromonadales bacterium]